MTQKHEVSICCWEKKNGALDKLGTNPQIVKSSISVKYNKVKCSKCETGSACIWKSFRVYSEKVPGVLFFCTFTLRKYINVFNIYLILSINENFCYQ